MQKDDRVKRILYKIPLISIDYYIFLVQLIVLVIAIIEFYREEKGVLIGFEI